MTGSWYEMTGSWYEMTGSQYEMFTLCIARSRNGLEA